MSATRTDQVTVDAGSFDLHVWLPAAGRGPAVLLIQEIFGVGSYIRAVAERLAEAGYVVGAPDVFWRIQPGWAADHDEAGLAASMGVVQQLDFPQAVLDCAAALAHLEGLAEVTGTPGVLGFCMGGTLAWAVAGAASPACCVSYYGSGVPGLLDLVETVTCPTLFHFGDADPYLPMEGVEALNKAITGHSNFTVNVESAGHAFDNHEAPMFWDETAAGSAWAKTMAFLGAHLPTS